MSSAPSQSTHQDDSWEKMFSFDPTKSPFLPQSNVGPCPTSLNSNLDIFSAQPLFLPESYLPQPNYYPDHPAPQIQIASMLPYESASGFDFVEGNTQSSTFDAIRGDLDKVIMSVWQLKNDYQTRIVHLDNEVAKASEAAETLRKDVDAIGDWVQQVVAFLNGADDPVELPCTEQPNEAQEDPNPAGDNQAQ
ncbi:hypothetical protein ACJQWK_08466 [Exserohilum turcicum]